MKKRKLKRDVTIKYGDYPVMMKRLREKLGDVEFDHELKNIGGDFAVFGITYTGIGK